MHADARFALSAAGSSFDRLIALLVRHSERATVPNNVEAGSLACIRIGGPLLFGRLWERLGLGDELEPSGEGDLTPRCVKDEIEERLFERRRDRFTDLSLVLQIVLADLCGPHEVSVEWDDLVRDLDRLQKASIEKNDMRVTMRTPVSGRVWHVLQAAGIALPPNWRELRAWSSSPRKGVHTPDTVDVISRIIIYFEIALQKSGQTRAPRCSPAPRCSTAPRARGASLPLACQVMTSGVCFTQRLEHAKLKCPRRRRRVV